MITITKALIAGFGAGAIATATASALYNRSLQSTPPGTVSVPSTPGDPLKVFKQRVIELASAREDLYRSHGVSGATINENEQVLLQMLHDYASRNSTSPYNFGIYNLYRNIQREFLQANEATRVLEIGPGVNLGVGLIFALSGAQKYYGLDVYMDPDLFKAAPYETTAHLLKLVGDGKPLRSVGSVMTIKDGKVEFKKERIEYLYPRQSYDIPLANASLDYVFSHATLEHVLDPARTIQSIYRVLRKEGLTAHQIDMRDHSDMTRPLEFLKIDETSWKEQWKDPKRAPWYMNRWRLSDFKAAFQSAGFRILRVDVNANYPVDESLRSQLDKRFQKYSLEDLAATGAMIIARKE